MNYQSLIASIQAAIYNNGAELITGNVLQGVLLDMVNALDSAGATYGGTITPASAAPADLDQPTVYLALEAGTYTNYLDSGGNPIVTTGPALITYNGGASLVFSKTDLPSGGTGATVITNDGSDGDSVAIRLTENGSYQRTFRIDMAAEHSGYSNEQRIGSLLMECRYDADIIAHGYYYGDDMSDILTEVAVYKDDTDPDTFYLMLQHDSSLDSVTFAITPLDGGEVDAFITNAADDHTKADDATITPVGGGSSDVFVAKYGVTTYQEISDALTAGKLILCKKDKMSAVLGLFNASAAYFFSALPGGGLFYKYQVTPQNSWTWGTESFERPGNKVSTISGNETSTTKYPNTMAVVGYAQKKWTEQTIEVTGEATDKIVFTADANATELEFDILVVYGQAVNNYLWVGLDQEIQGTNHYNIARTQITANTVYFKITGRCIKVGTSFMTQAGRGVGANLSQIIYLSNEIWGCPVQAPYTQNFGTISIGFNGSSNKFLGVGSKVTIRYR